MLLVKISPFGGIVHEANICFPFFWLSYKASATSLRFVVSKNGWFFLRTKDFTLALTTLELNAGRKV